MGVELEGDPIQRTAELSGAGTAGPSTRVTNADGVWQKVKLTTARAAGSIDATRDTRKEGEVAATVNAFGKGKVGAVYGPVASIYFRSHHPWLREFIGGLLTELFPDPMVIVEGPPTLDVALRKTRDGRLSVHLLNTTGMPLPDRYGFTEFIPPIENIRVTIRTGVRPKTVTWVPDGGRLDWSWKDGKLIIVVPRLHIHGAVIWE